MIKLVAALLLVGGAAADFQCSDCITMANSIVDLNTHNLDDQVAVISGTLCPSAPDPAACEAGVRDVWPAVGTLIFSTAFTPNLICRGCGGQQETGLPVQDNFLRSILTSTKTRVIECADCVAALTTLVDAYEQDQNLAFLAGIAVGGYCPTATFDNCDQVLAQFVPPAMTVLFEYGRPGFGEFCNMMFSVC